MFHLLDDSEIDFEFERPTRFVDLEGGAAIMADPSIMAPQYRSAIAAYLVELGLVMREAAVDYHRVSLADPVDRVLARFLVGRAAQKK